MNEIYPFELNEKKRANIYQQFLESQKNCFTVEKIARLGEKLMRKESVHPHFFGDFSLYAVALYLIFFSLNLPTTLFVEAFLKYPRQRKNPAYLKLLSRELQREEVLAIIALFERIIIERIPVEYITNEAFYLDNTFFVNEHVLVPRSIMNRRFKDFLNEMQWENYRVLDLCTGSGCIGISLSLLHPNIQVELSDISPLALQVANMNIQRYDLQKRVKCIKSDLFGAITDRYDLIISNPPYVSVRDYQASPKEFKQEPKIALEAGQEGMDIIHRILKEARPFLNTHGRLIVEVGSATAKRVKKQYPKIPFKWYKYKRPNGKESFFDSPGVFQCNAEDLP